MKNAKKLLALVLCVALIFCLAACSILPGKKDKKDGIDGKWVAKLDMTKMLAEEFAYEYGVDEKDVPDLILYWQLKFEDGEYEARMVEKETLKEYDKFLEGFEKLLIDLLYKEGEDYGYEKSECSEAFEEEYGMSIEDYVAEYIDEEMTFENFFGEFDESIQEGFYKVKKDKLYIADEEEDLDDSGDYVVFEISGDELVFKSFEGNPFDFEDMEDIFPITFEKK